MLGVSAGCGDTAASNQESATTHSMDAIQMSAAVRHPFYVAFLPADPTTGEVPFPVHDRTSG